MLEILALIFATRYMGKLAVKKGLPAGRWKVYTVLAWFAAEIPLLVVGFLTFGWDNLLIVELLGIAGAVMGFLMIKGNLQRKPDVLEDDIQNIGNNP